jgi:oxygen-independent coproporphyrinogen III oxidase
MPGLSATAAKSCVGQGYSALIQVSFHRLKTPSAAPTVPPLEPSQGAIDDSRPLGVYVHFPFCGSRCPYCDFAVAVRSEIPHDAYADSVLSELSVRAPWWKGESGPHLASIYFGGGTPGLWRPVALGRVLLGARQALADSAELEITVEANPGDLDGTNLRDLRNLGVNRLSFGAQAFQDRLLRRIGRRHEAAAIPRAFEVARAAGFDNLCADLMFGLPGQSMNDWRASLAALCALGPEHITAYALTVEPGTRFGALDRAGKLDRPEEDVVAAMYTTCNEVLTAAGFEHYEISSYARPGRRSVHNSLYWTMGSYLGLGVSASSFRPLTSGKGWRFSNSRSVSTYLRDVHTFNGAVPPEQIELRSPAQLEDEALWLGLRMSDGVDRYAHKRRYGNDPLALPERAAAANACVAAGWMQVTPERLRLLPAGFLFADEVAVRLGRQG